LSSSPHSIPRSPNDGTAGMDGWGPGGPAVGAGLALGDESGDAFGDITGDIADGEPSTRGLSRGETRRGLPCASSSAAMSVSRSSASMSGPLALVGCCSHGAVKPSACAQARGEGHCGLSCYRRAA
jgi:hypothetical protein